MYETCLFVIEFTYCVETRHSSALVPMSLVNPNSSAPRHFGTSAKISTYFRCSAPNCMSCPKCLGLLGLTVLTVVAMITVSAETDVSSQVVCWELTEGAVMTRAWMTRIYLLLASVTCNSALTPLTGWVHVSIRKKINTFSQARC